MRPPGLFETMRVEDGAVLRLEGHLTRLMRSAQRFAIPVERDDVLREIDRALADTPAAPVLRLRLDLEPTGRLRARTRPFVDDAIDPAPVVLSEACIDADHPHQRHKTVNRERYDAATSWAASNGVADVLFLDARGRVAEGAISNVFVRDDGRLLTPRVEDGALPGVLRAELLAAGAAFERSLFPADLAEGLHLGSSLRGLRRAVLIGVVAAGRGIGR